IMDQIIERLTQGIIQYNPKQTDIPARSGFNYQDPFPGLVEWMPLHQLGNKVVNKLVGYHPENPKHFDIPTILSTIAAYDTTTGHLLGLMDGVLPTALRTGAASAIATRALAHPQAKILGLIGCGAQALTQLHALSRVFDLQRVMIYDIDAPTQQTFPDRAALLSLPLSFEPSNIEDIIQSADIVCTATSIDVGAGPLFSHLGSKDHLHINAVGSDFPGKVELPLDFLTQSYVVPDFRAQAVVEGECQQLEAGQIGDDWTKILKDPSKYEFVKAQRTVFDSTGWALEDQLCFDLFFEYAEELGLGNWLEIEMMPEDAKNPYEFINQTSLKFNQNY
ncbi:MAG: ornithine cyclodeaminase family protein, partial [Bacteroidota bacterium]